MTVLHFNKFYADKHAVDDAVKQHAANTSHGPQFVPECAPMLIDADPLDHAETGIEYVSTRQMCWACAVVFVVNMAVSFLPISIWGVI